MPTALVLLNTEIGSEKDVLRELRKMSSIEDAFLVYGGAFDILLRIQSSTMIELRRTITWEIRKMDSVTATQTMIVV